MYLSVAQLVTLRYQLLLSYSQSVAFLVDVFTQKICLLIQK